MSEPRTQPVRRVLAAAVAGLALVAASGCGGSSPHRSQAAPALQVATWPRYWQTAETAEKGHVTDNLETFWAGYDGDTVVYTGVDVVRGLDKATGHQTWKHLLPPGQAICAVPDNPVVADHTVVFGIAPQGLGSDTRCTRTVGLDSTTGRQRWEHHLTSQDSTVQQHLVVSGHQVVISFDQPGGMPVLASVDLGSGTVTWSKTKLAAIAPKELREYAPERCGLRIGMAASDPVLLGVLSCLGLKEPAVFGLDAATGRVLWAKTFWAPIEDEAPPEVQPHPTDARLWTGAETFEHVKIPTVWFDDPRTGHWTVVPDVDVTPTKTKVGPDREYFVGPATPIGRQSEYSSSMTEKQVFLAGETAVYVKSLEQRSDRGSVVVAVSLPSGRRLWRREFFGKYTGATGLGGALGFTPDGKEFWVSDDDEHVSRIDTRTGREIGRGTLRPPLALTLFDVIGDDFLLQRGTPGIYQQESGLSLYQWRSGRKS